MPVVALEPSCLAVFRDEMPGLRPHDQDAKRLQGQIFTLAEFLSRSGYQPPVLHRDLLVHGHCHQKAVIGLEAEKKLFQAMGAHAHIVDDGCCGMAGSFGFEERKYDTSMKVYEHQLGPRLRQLPTETLVLADGFSCRTQIDQATGRRPLHLAQFLRMARTGDSEAIGNQRAVPKGGAKAAVLAIFGVGIALAAWCLTRRFSR